MDLFTPPLPDPDRFEVKARIELDKSLTSEELERIADVLKKYGFERFEIEPGECDILEMRHELPEVVFRAPKSRVAFEILKLLRRGKVVICGSK